MNLLNELNLKCICNIPVICKRRYLHIRKSVFAFYLSSLIYIIKLSVQYSATKLAMKQLYVKNWLLEKKKTSFWKKRIESGYLNILLGLWHTYFRFHS